MNWLIPAWMGKPVKARWARTKRGISILRPLDTDLLRDERFARARDLAKAMGFRGEISDHHAAQIILVLGGYVPGLTYQLPDNAGWNVDLPVLQWTPSRAGRPSKWTADDRDALRVWVSTFQDGTQSRGKPVSDRRALEDFRSRWTAGAPPPLSTLQKLLRCARREHGLKAASLRPNDRG